MASGRTGPRLKPTPVRSGVNVAIDSKGLTLNGTIYLGNESGSSDGYLTLTSTPFIGSISGGEIVFGGSAANKINATGSQGLVLIIGPNVTIHGQRGSFSFGNMTVLNQGRIAANKPAGLISLSGRILINAGTLEAAKGATLSATGITTEFTNSGSVLIGTRAKLILSIPYVQTVGTTVLQRGSLSAGSIDILGGALSGSGFLYGNVSNAGEILPGGNGYLGRIEITGNYQGPGKVSIDLGGANAGQFDELVVSGSAVFAGGTLTIAVINNFRPDPFIPDTFRVITFGSHTLGDDFTTYVGLDLGGGDYLVPVFDDTGLTLVTSN